LVTEENNNVKFDDRLAMPLVFVCKIFSRHVQDFASLAISNSIDEELDWIEHNDFHADSKDKKITKNSKGSKIEANGWVINRK